MTDENTNEAVEEKAKSAIRKKVSGVTKDSKVTVIAESNPKRPSSAAHTRFQAYLDNADSISTVADCLALGLTVGDLHYDFIHGSVTIEGAEVIGYEPKPRGSKATVVVDGNDADAETVAEPKEAEEEASEMF